ncbi:alginate lyase family protein [Clostridium baratii]|uniref:alginate lyase family protein n=1 Tax=Clostridium baratii TaxID=1561 RepID=UPI0030CFCF4A
MNKYLWLFNRLKAMSIKEIMYRLDNKFKIKSYKKISEKSLKISEINDDNIDLEIVYKNLNKMFLKPYIDNIIENLNYDVFNDYIEIKEDINWHKGIDSDWNKNIFSKDIEFKNRDEIGDVRYSWEINRHLFFPYIALLYIKTNEKKYFDLLEDIFKNWESSNLYMMGINWSSSMEIAIRSYNWLITVFILQNDNDCKNICEKLIRSIIISSKYIDENLSLYSSANNHLILEAAILSINGLALNGVYNQEWFEKGYNILEEEIEKQFHSDGINKEQALHYQGFVTDMLLQYNSIMRNTNNKPIHEIIIRKSIEFIGAIKANKVYRDFGDSDDAKILLISNKKYNYYNYILSFASYYYGQEFTDNIQNYNEISLFLKFTSLEMKHKYKNFYIYKNGGYSVINHEKTNLLFDFGELGFGSLAAHGHADALMFLYSYKDKNFFIDSGTYIYNIKNNKRNYYRGTNCHNTLSYANTNQSVILGPFLWGKKSNSRLLEAIEKENKYILIGENDGYKPHNHKRELEYIKNNNILIIRDYFDCKATINFILDKNIKIKKINEKIYELINDDVSIFIYCKGKMKIENIVVSEYFFSEDKSKKIYIDYNFDKEHTTIISPNLKELYNILKEMEYLDENS